TDRAEPTLREYKAVRALIQERLLNEKRSKRLRALLDQLKGNTKVEIDQKALDAMFGAKETPPASGASA
ncbi:MAG: hypothetical protein WCG06_02265, partial [Candidatus Omnitrophota bacterium]